MDGVVLSEVKTEAEHHQLSHHHQTNTPNQGLPVNSKGSKGGANLRFSATTTTTPVRATTLSGVQLQTMAKTSGLSIVQLPQSVIQSPGVIQNAGGVKNVILVSKGNSSVIQSLGQPGGGQGGQGQVLEGVHSEDSLSNDGEGHPQGSRDRKRREILTRRPSYRKILNDLGGTESIDKGDSATGTSESSQDSSGDIILGGNTYPGGVVKVLGGGAISLDNPSQLQTITMTNAGGAAGGTIVQYAQSHDGQQFFVPVGGELQAYTIRPVTTSSGSGPSVVVSGGGGSLGGTHVPEEATRKREIRLLKNREAARECRRKKKEYIKCLENRVAVLENQNKALIDELKSLKELYCSQKTE